MLTLLLNDQYICVHNYSWPPELSERELAYISDAIWRYNRDFPQSLPPFIESIVMSCWNYTRNGNVGAWDILTSHSNLPPVGDHDDWDHLNAQTGSGPSYNIVTSELEVFVSLENEFFVEINTQNELYAPI